LTWRLTTPSSCGILIPQCGRDDLWYCRSRSARAGSANARTAWMNCCAGSGPMSDAST
jgi:hypothetical protein